MDQSTLNKILDYNRLKVERGEIDRRIQEAKSTLLSEIGDIAIKASLTELDLLDALRPF